MTVIHLVRFRFPSSPQSLLHLPHLVQAVHTLTQLFTVPPCIGFSIMSTEQSCKSQAAWSVMISSDP